jgi:hypothetical protein
LKRKLRALGMAAVSTAFLIGSGITTAFADGGTNSGGSLSKSSGAKSSAQAVQLTANDAVSMVTKLFPEVTKISASPNVQLQPDFTDSQRMTYQINWSSPAMNRVMGPNLNGNNFVFAEVDANTGQILSFQNGKSSWETGKWISLQKAEQIATTALQKLAPQAASQLTLAPSTGPDSNGYSFLFIRKVNGIWAPFDKAIVTLDETGKLVAYSFNWHEVTFPAVPATVLSQDTAVSKYQSALHLQLQYQTIYAGGSGLGSLELTYAPKISTTSNGFFDGTGEPLIDAASGQTLGSDGLPYVDSAAPSLQPLVPGGPENWPTASGKVMDHATLEQQIRQQYNLSTTDWTLSNTSDNQSTGGPLSNHPSEQFSFSNVQTNDQVTIGIDATDGVVMQFNENGGQNPNASSVPALTSDQLQQDADQFVKETFPYLTGAIAHQVQTNNGPPEQAFFSYQFLYQGLPLGNFPVILNSATGQVQDYNLQVDPSATFPSPAHAMTEAAAESAFILRDPLVLQYLLPTQVTQKVSNAAPQYTYGATAQVVYSGMPTAYGIGTLNAVTGEWSEFSPLGPSLSQQTGDTTGSGSPADVAIAELEQNQVIQPSDGKVDEQAIITRAQFVRWLARAYNYNISTNNPPQFSDVPATNSYATDLSEALMQGWLAPGDRFHPNDPLTRSGAANLLVQWLGWTGPAANSTLFKLPFSDQTAIPQADLGAAAIAVDEDMLPLVKGKFNPNAELTVGQAAIALAQAVQVVLAEENHA